VCQQIDAWGTLACTTATTLVGCKAAGCMLPLIAPLEGIVKKAGIMTASMSSFSVAATSCLAALVLAAAESRHSALASGRHP